MSFATILATPVRKPLELVEANFRKPTGWFGRLLGHVMTFQHRSLTDWTIARMNVEPADCVLDIGCGGGMAVKLLSRITTEGVVAGIDYSLEMVRQAARRNARALKGGRVDIRLGDVLALPWPDASFDQVCGIETLYFWPDALAGLREARRVLKPGGRITITLEMSKEAAAQTSRLRKYFTQRYARRAARIGQAILSGPELVALLEQAGFRDTCYVAEPDRSLGWLSATGFKS